MGKKKSTDDGPDGSGVVVLFTALMIVMLAFFIVLVSMSKIEEVKKAEALKSIYATFGNMPGGRSPFMSSGFTSHRDEKPMTELEQDFQLIKEIAFEFEGHDQVRLITDGFKRIISINDEVLFEPERIEIKTSALLFLAGLASTVAEGAYWIKVTGHTDDIPPDPRGPADDNWTLSSMRALSVLKFLQNQGVSSKRLSAFGYGPILPLRPNNSAENRRNNHRVDLILDESMSVPLELLKENNGAGKAKWKGFVFDLFGDGKE